MALPAHMLRQSAKRCASARCSAVRFAVFAWVLNSVGQWWGGGVGHIRAGFCSSETGCAQPERLRREGRSAQRPVSARSRGTRCTLCIIARCWHMAVCERCGELALKIIGPTSC